MPELLQRTSKASWISMSSASWHRPRLVIIIMITVIILIAVIVITVIITVNTTIITIITIMVDDFDGGCGPCSRKCLA